MRTRYRVVVRFDRPDSEVEGLRAVMALLVHLFAHLKASGLNPSMHINVERKDPT